MGVQQLCTFFDMFRIESLLTSRLLRQPPQIVLKFYVQETNIQESREPKNTSSAQKAGGRLGSPGFLVLVSLEAALAADLIMV